MRMGSLVPRRLKSRSTRSCPSGGESPERDPSLTDCCVCDGCVVVLIVVDDRCGKGGG